MFNLAGRVAVITGGAGALGLGVARVLQARGAKVGLVGRSKKKLDEALTELRAVPPSASVHICDVSDEGQLVEVREDVIERYGRIDILVTCAAAPASAGKFEDTALETWRRTLSTDLDGVYLACKIFGTPMIKQNYGRIVNLTSFHNVATYPYRSIYNAAKSGVEGLSRALAIEWGHHGITVNCVAPGPLLTPRTQWFLSQDPTNEEGMLGRTPSVRVGEVADLSATIAFLVSEEARHINGQQIVLDGGWTKNAWWGKHTDLL